MGVHRDRSDKSRLTRKERARRPLRLAGLAALAVVAVGALGALVHPLVGAVGAIAVGTALLVAITARDLGVLRIRASEQAAMSLLQPLWKGEVHGLRRSSPAATACGC